MSSRYLAALNRSIDQSSPSLNLSCLRAERAAYLARLGDVAGAHEEIRSIRAQEAEADGRLTALINLADGLCHYYRSMSSESHDRFSRAYAIAMATRNFDVASRASAWLALLAYGAYDFTAISRHISLSDGVRYNDPICAARNSLTIAQILHLANRFDLARVWYQRAHRMAAEIEDDAMISAILHNMSSLWVANIRNQTLGMIETADRDALASVGVHSTLNFDEIVGSTSQPSFTPLMRAQLLSTQGRYSEALELYNIHLDRLNIEAVHGWQQWLFTDHAWCMLHCGEKFSARDEFDRLSRTLSDSDHVDDVGAAFRRISQGYEALGIEQESHQYGLRADTCWRTFRSLQAEMLVVASSYSSWLTEPRK